MAVNDLQEMQRRLQTPTMRDNMPQSGQPAIYGNTTTYDATTSTYDATTYARDKTKS